MTTTATDFDLKDEACKLLEISPDPDPKAIIPALVAVIPDDYLRPVLELLLPNYVLNINRERRRRPVPDPAPGGNNRRQSKQSMIKTLAEGIRDRREVLGDGEWKRLRHLSMGDVEAIIGAFVRRASANELEAKRYTRLLTSMKTAKVAQAGDLPDELLVELFR